MSLFPFREPMNALTHGFWLVVCIPAVVILLSRARGDRLRVLGIAIYGLSLMACFASSWLFHAINGSQQAIDMCNTLDHVSIFFFIAGSSTPVGLVYLRGSWRKGFLSAVWLLAGTGILLRLSGAPLPLYARTTLYLLLGWIGCLTYFQLSRRLSTRQIAPIWVGGILYTLGAGINMAGQPTLVEGILGPHEIFHLLVMAGSLAHYYFILAILLGNPRPLDIPSAIPENSPHAPALLTAADGPALAGSSKVAR